MPPGAIRVAVPVPVPGAFSYLATESTAPGSRVLVQFGARRLVGVVLPGPAPVYDGALKPVLEVLDDTPSVHPDILALLEWAAGYYHHPIGEVLQHGLPVALRRAREARPDPGLRPAPALDLDDLARAPRQQQAMALLIAWLQDHQADLCPRPVLTARLGQAVVRALERRGAVLREPLPAGLVQGRGEAADWPLSAQQQAALATVRQGDPGFATTLLEGVTGSGKTEVYLQLMRDALASDRQALLLVPEIGLTPQLMRRLAERLEGPLAMLHSGLTDRQRLDAWRAAASGRAGAVIGTRSAVFTPLPRLGLIIVDEEHDPSYKQQDGFRYSARDLAVKRARERDVPIVLGSATPALETFHNARTGRYRLARMMQRTSPHPPPRYRFADLTATPATDGLSDPVLRALEQRLAAGEQSLVFLNRRGFAPVLICNACGWTADCERCSGHYTLHSRPGRLHCHHCDRRTPLPTRCPGCGSDRLGPVGLGTQRLTARLERHFGPERVLRIDRDLGPGDVEAGLARLAGGEPLIAIGTQLLAKGHDFPRLTLVVVANADAGLFSLDFRAGERVAQLITQVAGRAGRADRPGEVWLQTLRTDHPLLRRLATGDYEAVARALLAEREASQWPPFGHIAMLRSEAVQASAARDALQALVDPHRDRAAALGVWLLGPVPAPLERRGGRHRAQLLLQSGRRAALHTLLEALEPALGRGSGARLTLDVDPLDTF